MALQVSLGIAAVFLISHSVRWIPNIWELQQTGTDKVSKSSNLHLRFSFQTERIGLKLTFISGGWLIHCFPVTQCNQYLIICFLQNLP